MKYIITLIFSFIFIVVFLNHENNEKSTKVIITIPNLTEVDINHYLKNQFSNSSDIEYIDGSIAANTIVLKVNEHTFNKSTIENILNRWGLESDGYAFENIYSSSEFE